jgi:hypothetical protein
MITKNAVSWDATLCGSCKNQHSRRIYRFHHQGERINELGTILAITSNSSTLQRTTDYTRKEATELNSTLTYEQRGWLLSQQIMEASYVLPKTIGTCSPYTSVAIAPGLLKPSSPRLLISQPLVVWSFNLSPQNPPHHNTPATCWLPPY